MKLNPKKCSFVVSKVEVLGQVVSEERVKTDQSKMDHMEKARVLQAKELRFSLMFCSLYRHFVNGFATITILLQELRMGNVQFRWSVVKKGALQDLKE